MKNILKRVSEHFLVRIIIALLFVGVFVAGAFVFKMILKNLGVYDTLGGRTAFTGVFVLMLYLGYSFYVKKIEKREVKEYSKKRLLKELLMGMGIGAGLISLQVLILWMLGLYTISSVALSSGIYTILLLSVITGFGEELINKGILFRICEEKLGSWIALLIVGFEVGITHMSNSGATTLSTLAVSLEFGIMLVLIYMLTRRLWVVTGFHFAWNFTMGGIFGQNVSGIDVTGLFVSELKGPNYLTGGEFGIEVGVIAIVLSLLISVLLFLHILKKKSFIKPFWRK